MPQSTRRAAAGAADATGAEAAQRALMMRGNSSASESVSPPHSPLRKTPLSLTEPEEPEGANQNADPNPYGTLAPVPRRPQDLSDLVLQQSPARSEPRLLESPASLPSNSGTPTSVHDSIDSEVSRLNSRAHPHVRSPPRKGRRAPPPPAACDPEPVRPRPSPRRIRRLGSLFKAHAREVMTERMAVLDSRADEAVLCLVDAREGRLNHGLAVMSKKGWWTFNVFSWQTSREWLNLLVLANVLHCLVCLWGWRGDSAAERALSWACTFCYLADMGMKMFYEGFGDYLSKGWQRWFAGACTLILVGEIFPPLRCLSHMARPLISSFRVRVVRRFFRSIMDTIPGSLRILFPMVVIVLLSTMLVYTVSGRELQEREMTETRFRSPLSVAATLWGLMLSLDSYTELLHMKDPVAAFTGFVFLFIIVGHIFLLSLLVGVTYEVFVENTKEQLEADRKKELKGIVKAFAVMDPTGTGELSLTQWHRFTSKLCKGRITKMQSFVYYHLLAHKPEKLDCIDFLHIFEVFNYDVRMHVDVAGTAARRLANAFFDESLQGGTWLSAFTTIMDCLMWFLYHEGPLGMAAFEVGPWRASKDFLQISFACSTVLVASWLVELNELRKRGLYDIPIAQLAWLLGVLSALGVALLSVHQGHASPVMHIYDTSNTVVGATTVQLVSFAGLILRCLRVFDISDVLMDHLHGFFLLAPALYYSILSAAVVIYVFSQICYFSLGALVPDAFGTPGGAMMTGTQIFMGVDVEHVLEEVSRALYPYCARVLHGLMQRFEIESEGEALAVLATLTVQFFIRAYHTFGTLIMFNLVTAVVINFYQTSMSEMSETSRRQQLDREARMCENLVKKLMSENVLSLWKRADSDAPGSGDASAFEKVSIEFNRISIHRRQNPIFGPSDMRMRAKLTGFGSDNRVEVTDAQLKSCAKYAPPGLDLVEMARARKRNWQALPT